MRKLFITRVLCAGLITASLALTQTHAGESQTASINDCLDRQFEVLHQVQSELESDSVDRAEEFEAALEFIEEWAQSRRNLARAMNVRAPDQSARESIADYLQANENASVRRIEMPLVQLAREAGDMPAEKYAERLETMLDAFQEVRQAGQALDELREDFDLQPSIWVYGPDRAQVPDSGEFVVTYRVENLTAEDPAPLEVQMEQVRGGEPLSIQVTPKEIGELAPGEVAIVEVQGRVEDDVDMLVGQLTFSVHEATELHTLQLRR